MVFVRRVKSLARYALESITGPARLLVSQRSLLKLLVKREMVARTSGTLLGGAWMLVQPALQVLGLWFFLHVILKVRSPGQVPFVDYFLVGMIAWLMINEILQRNLTVLVEFGTLYQRTIFPLPLLPLLPILVSGVIYGAVFMAVSTLLGGALAGLKAGLTAAAILLWLLPFSYLMAVLGLFVREARQVIPFLLTLLMYLTPILYLPELLPQSIRPWMALNPIADIMALVHAAVQGSDWTWGNALRPLMLWAILLPLCWMLFKRTEPHMREAL
ncbi:MAG: ABC transporter permease [Pseudomonadota bacterium]